MNDRQPIAAGAGGRCPERCGGRGHLGRGGRVSIKSRLRRLEDRARGVRGCPECGDSPPSPKMIAVYAEDTAEELRFFPDPEIPEGEPFCPECGRQQYLILTIVYDR
jgi:hypothetical protein